MWRRPWRVAKRLPHFGWFCATALWDFNRSVRPHERAQTDYRRRALWSQRHARRLARVLGMEVRPVGPVPAAQIYCANHLGYLDIVALVAAAPAVFVSKAEVRNWPVVGALTNAAGTLYLKRERKEDLAGVMRQFDPVIAAGVPVVVFLEGTSSGGEDVLPFKPSLLAPAVSGGWHCAPVALDYTLEPGDGTVAEHVAYWRDMTFGPHFLGLLGRKRIHARVSFGEPLPAGPDRKQLALALRERVISLRASRS